MPAPATAVLGSTTPRLWTPPLVTGPPGPCGCGCALTPETSYGFDAVAFARDQLHHPLDPWERWAAIHGGELLPDGRPRFRVLVILVARQNGKTELVVVLSLFWQFVESVSLILGTSTKLDYAKESWTKAVKLAERSPALDALRPARWKREANGEQESWTTEDARYKIAASNEEGGRSLTIERLILDELRQHHDYSAWSASEEATSAVRDAQIWGLSNAGDDRSVVLNDLHESALEFIAWVDEVGAEHVGELLAQAPGDYRLGLFEWSAPEDADPTDLVALAQANPNLGRRKDPEVLLLKARRAVKLGGQALAGFMTESMCIRVKQLNPAIDPGAWQRRLEVGDLSAVRRRVALCLDVAPDGEHVTLMAAAVLPDDRVRVEVVAAWDSTATALAELFAKIAEVKPMAFGWFPDGPAAALAAKLATRYKRRGWPLPGMKIEDIRSDVTAVCMGFADVVKAGGIAHSGDPLLDAQVGAAEKLKRGGAGSWVFGRGGLEHVDAVYAAAGAVHLARTLPPPVGKPRLRVIGG